MDDPITERLRQAAQQERAPEQLRARIVAMKAEQASRSRRPVVLQRPAFGLSLAAGLAVGLAVAALVVVLALPAGTPGAPSISQAASLGTRAPTAVAPSLDPANPSLLAAHVGSLRFPRRAAEATVVGERSDRIGDRTAVTVYYRTGRQLLAYTIVSGRPLKVPYGWDASEYTATRFAHRNLVAWRQDGHTCLVSAAGVSRAALLLFAHHA
jgi:hypothetical protein